MVRTRRDELKKQVREYITSIAYMYLNGANDVGAGDYPKLTERQWIDYILREWETDVAHNMGVNGMEFRHLRFFGKQAFIDEIRKVVAEDEDVRQWTVKAQA